MIRDFIVRQAEDSKPLLGTTVRIDAQDGRTFSIGSNINNGDGIGELGAGFQEADGIITILNYTGQRATPTIPLARLAGNAAGEMGVKIVDGPFGAASRLDITLPFVSA